MASVFAVDEDISITGKFIYQFNPALKVFLRSSVFSSHYHFVSVSIVFSISGSTLPANQTMAYHKVAFVALSLLSLSTAKPLYRSSSNDHHASTSTSYISTSTSFPTQVPDSKNLLLSNGFPNLSPEALNQVNLAAHGTLSNTTGAKPVTNPDSLANFQLIAFNEFFEVAFFTSLLTNITNHVDGFEIPGHLNSTLILDTLIAVQAQEQLHAINANTKLPMPLKPCEYRFPSTSFTEAIALAATFTDVVLGTLQDAATVFAANGDGAIVRGVASALGQEGQQSGFYRGILGRVPPAQPFLTASARDFAFSALVQGFVVPGSCDTSGIPLTVFGALALETREILPVDQTLQFSFDLAGYGVGVQDLQFVYISGQNVPVVEDMVVKSRDEEKVVVEVEFPFVDKFLFGLTVGAVVRKGEPVGNVDQVAMAAVFGPAFIEVL